MNKVYILTYQSTYDDYRILTVFTSEEEANDHLDKISSHSDRMYFEVEEWDIYNG